MAPDDCVEELPQHLKALLEAQWNLDSSDSSQLASALHVTHRTVDAYYQEVYVLLDVTTRSGALTRAIKRGLIAIALTDASRSEPAGTPPSKPNR